MSRNAKTARDRLVVLWLGARLRWRSWRSGYPINTQMLLDVAAVLIAKGPATAPSGMIPRLEHLLKEARRLRRDPDRVRKLQPILAEMRDALQAALRSN